MTAAAQKPHRGSLGSNRAPQAGASKKCAGQASNDPVCFANASDLSKGEVKLPRPRETSLRSVGPTSCSQISSGPISRRPISAKRAVLELPEPQEPRARLVQREPRRREPVQRRHCTS